MDTNENSRNNVPEDVIELGVASVETKGVIGPSEGAGDGTPFSPGISDN